MRHLRVLVSSLVPFLVCLPAVCQEVISAHSGTLHFFEGAVSIDGQAVDHKPAVFPNIPQGSTLSTEKGRAEVLLTPNVVLRLDEDSAFRLVSNSLTDTQVEFVRGSAILDTMSAAQQPPVVLIYEHFRIRFPKPGIYRIDSDTGVFQAYSGEAQITTPEGKTPAINTSNLFFFDLGTLTNKFGEPNEDEFYDWARGRADAMAAENQLAEEGNQDSDNDNSAAGIFNAPLPSYGTLPPYSSLGGGYALTDPWLNPFFGFTGGAGLFAYNPFPVFLIVQRPRHWGSGMHWGFRHKLGLRHELGLRHALAASSGRFRLRADPHRNVASAHSEAHLYAAPGFFFCSTPHAPGIFGPAPHRSSRRSAPGFSPLTASKTTEVARNNPAASAPSIPSNPRAG